MDVLGIQEAQGWAASETNMAQVVADELGMNVVVGEAHNSNDHVVLFSRHEISAARTYSDDFSRAVLHATITLGGGESVEVIVVHLVAGQDHDREFERLTEIIEPFGSKSTILLGDFNIREERSQAFSILSAIGFEQAARDGPDFIFVTDEVGRLAGGVRLIETLDLDPPSTVSDHHPVGATIGRP